MHSAILPVANTNALPSAPSFLPGPRPSASTSSSRLLELSGPLIASSLTGYLTTTVSIAFVGRLGQQPLSIVILATSLFNVTGLSFIVGSLGALETLCGQAYGAKNYRGVAAALQRALLLTGLLTLLVVAFWVKSEALMLATGQDAALAAGAARFLHLSVPALGFLGAAECIKRYLTSQQVVAPATLASLAALCAAPLFNWALVFGLGMGLDGAAHANNLSQFVPLVVLLFCAARRETALKGGPEQAWHGWTKEALSGWGIYLRLAWPSTAMVCLEWWTFELCVLMAGRLARPQLSVAVMGLCLNVTALLYMIPLGLGTATAVRVGNALGAAAPIAARRASFISLGLVFCTQTALAIIVLAAKRPAVRYFTDDEEVIAAASALFPLMAWCMIGDGVNAAMAGVLRGAGRQDVGAASNLAAYWLVGLPLAAALAFWKGMGVAGLWTGLAICATLNAIAMIGILLLTDWNRQARRAVGTAGATEACDSEGAALLRPPSAAECSRSQNEP
jgi:multidrug resistance protein, MATE family